MRIARFLALGLAVSTPTIAEPISILDNALCDGIGVRLDKDFTTVVCAGNLVINNARITSATDLTLKADGAIRVNADITFNSFPPLESGGLAIRGVLNDSVISLANAPIRDPRFSIRLMNTQTEPLVGSVISIGTAAVPAPSTLALLLGVLALGLGQRFRR